ncbi:hypothetical protein [Actinomadura flavalba]|uniref:hypothetical protein n=1 Tax=Actinomadura flavalba TaxID=1120938 RepID=UPI00036B4EC9|nr:hypothetical protein [Actinomadura flavalba]
MFYALGDTRTPGLLAIPAALAQAAVAVALLALADPADVVVGLPLAYGLFFVLGSAGAVAILRRRLGGMDGRRITRTLAKLYAASVPGGLVAAAAVWGCGHLPGDRLPAVLAVLTGSLAGGLVFLGAARLLRVGELGYFLELARRRMRRSGRSE